jgi:hypothetical protein
LNTAQPSIDLTKVEEDTEEDWKEDEEDFAASDFYINDPVLLALN